MGLSPVAQVVPMLITYLLSGLNIQVEMRTPWTSYSGNPFETIQKGDPYFEKHQHGYDKLRAGTTSKVVGGPCFPHLNDVHQRSPS